MDFFFFKSERFLWNDIASPRIDTPAGIVGSRMNGHILRRDKARTFDSLIFVSTGDFYYQPECFMKLQLKPRNGLFFFALYLPSLSYFSLCLLPPFFLTLTPFFLFLSLSLRSPISPSLSYSSSSLFLGFFFFVLLL